MYDKEIKKDYFKCPWIFMTQHKEMFCMIFLSKKQNILRSNRGKKWTSKKLNA